MGANTIKRVLNGIDINMEKPDKYDNPLICISGVSASEKSEFMLTGSHLSTGIGVIGATGQGKTYCIRKMLSDIRKNVNNYTMVVVQVKNDFDELYQEGDLFLEQGKNSSKSVKWNLFKEILSDGYDMEMVELNTRQFVNHLFSYKKNSNEQFFVEGAAELLYCIIITMIKDGKDNLHIRNKWNNKGLVEFFQKFTQEDYINVINKCGESGALNRILGDDNDNKQALGVWGELVTTALRIFVDIFGEDGDFSIREFTRDKKNHVLFINFDLNYKDIQVTLFGSIINLLFQEVLSRDNNVGSTFFVCDELSVIGKIDLASAVSVGRAKGLKTIVGFQSIAQINSVFGNEDGKTLLAGLGTKLYFKPGDEKTIEYMQKDFGREDVEYLTVSAGGVNSKIDNEYVITDSDIDKMQRGDFYVKKLIGRSFKFKMD